MPFLTSLQIEASDLPDEWVLLHPLIYVTRDTKYHIAVDKGFITDLASIPKALRAVFDVNGHSRKAAVVHDYLYSSHGLDGIFTRAECDQIFLGAMTELGVPLIERRAMWAGVRAGGWLYWRKRVDGLRQDYDFAESAPGA